MKATIKGMERIDYFSKKNNKQVDGVRMHIERKDPNVIGVCVDPIFISTQSLENLGCVIPEERYKECIGKPVEFEYNRFGMIASLAISG